MCLFLHARGARILRASLNLTGIRVLGDGDYGLSKANQTRDEYKRTLKSRHPLPLPKLCPAPSAGTRRSSPAPSGFQGPGLRTDTGLGRLRSRSLLPPDLRGPRGRGPGSLLRTGGDVTGEPCTRGPHSPAGLSATSIAGSDLLRAPARAP